MRKKKRRRVRLRIEKESHKEATYLDHHERQRIDLSTLAGRELRGQVVIASPSKQIACADRGFYLQAAAEEEGAEVALAAVEATAASVAAPEVSAVPLDTALVVPDADRGTGADASELPLKRRELSNPLWRAPLEEKPSGAA
jgi:hypothetical protein